MTRTAAAIWSGAIALVAGCGETYHLTSASAVWSDDGEEILVLVERWEGKSTVDDEIDYHLQGTDLLLFDRSGSPKETLVIDHPGDSGNAFYMRSAGYIVLSRTRWRFDLATRRFERLPADDRIDDGWYAMVPSPDGEIIARLAENIGPSPDRTIVSMLDAESPHHVLAEGEELTGISAYNWAWIDGEFVISDETRHVAVATDGTTRSTDVSPRSFPESSSGAVSADGTCVGVQLLPPEGTVQLTFRTHDEGSICDNRTAISDAPDDE